MENSISIRMISGRKQPRTVSWVSAEWVAGIHRDVFGLSGGTSMRELVGFVLDCGWEDTVDFISYFVQ